MAGWVEIGETWQRGHGVVTARVADPRGHA